MNLAFIIYDGMTTLDFIGAFDPLTRLKTMGFIENLEYDVCALSKRIKSIEQLELTATKVGGSLERYDYIIIPGGNGLIDLIQNKTFLDWIRTASHEATLAAVCGGSIILGVVGLLEGRRATTHLALFDQLARFTDFVVKDRIVDEGKIITARGVSSAIDLGLYLCEKIAGKEIKEQIQKAMDYLNYATK